MIAIRLQRRGRKGHAQYRVIVQESQLSPKSGRIIASLGSYDPHTKVAVLDTEKASFYLSNGAQPSDRVVKIFRAEKVKLPSWVNVVDKQKREVRNPEKLRKNQPAEETKDAVKEESVSSDDNKEADTEKEVATDAGEEEKDDVETSDSQAESDSKDDDKESE